MSKKTLKLSLFYKCTSSFLNVFSYNEENEFKDLSLPNVGKHLMQYYSKHKTEFDIF